MGLLSGFTINFAKPKKKTTTTTRRLSKVSRLCQGVVHYDETDSKFKIHVYNPSLNEESDTLILEFTDESLDLAGKTDVYSITSDKHGHYTRFIRTKSQARLCPGDPSKVSTVNENLVCTGYIIRKNGKLLFNLKATHGRGIAIYDLPTELDNSKPLFKYECDTNKPS